MDPPLLHLLAPECGEHKVALIAADPLCPRRRGKSEEQLPALRRFAVGGADMHLVSKSAGRRQEDASGLQAARFDTSLGSVQDFEYSKIIRCGRFPASIASSFVRCRAAAR